MTTRPINDRIAWLRAQFDEDERGALTFEVREGEWRCQHCGGAMTSAERLDSHLFETGRREWGPARVLAEVDAKRRRIEWMISGLEHERGGEDFPTYDSCRVLWIEDMAGDETFGYCSCGLDALRNQLFRFEALPYADRPGYREEWRP